MIKINELRRIIYRNSNLLRKNKTKLNNFLTNNLTGGGNRTLSITYNNHKYKFIETYDDNYFVLYLVDEYECVSGLKKLINKYINPIDLFINVSNYFSKA